MLPFPFETKKRKMAKSGSLRSTKKIYCDLLYGALARERLPRGGGAPVSKRRSAAGLSTAVLSESGVVWRQSDRASCSGHSPSTATSVRFAQRSNSVAATSPSTAIRTRFHGAMNVRGTWAAGRRGAEG